MYRINDEPAGDWDYYKEKPVKKEAEEKVNAILCSMASEVIRTAMDMLLRQVISEETENAVKDVSKPLDELLSEETYKYIRYMRFVLLPHNVHIRYQGKEYDPDFFAGVSECLTIQGKKINNEEFGLRVLLGAILHMKKIVEDKKEEDIFNLFEELVLHGIFYGASVLPVPYMKEPEKWHAYENYLKTAQQDFYKRLKETGIFTDKGAEELSNLLTDPLNMDDGCIYWWDDDANVIFSHGFLAGIENTAGFVGTRLGYGYELAKGMMEDLFIDDNLGFLGTEKETKEKVKRQELKYVKELNRHWESMEESSDQQNGKAQV